MAITISGGIPDTFISQFKNTLYHVCQQKESKFEQAVTIEPVLGAEDKAFDLMDEMTLEEKTSRNQQTPTIDPSHQRRWVSTTPFHNAVLKDKDDDLQRILDPKGDYMKALVRARNRKVDDIILAAFEATVTSGRRAGDTTTLSWANMDGNVKYTDSSGGRTIPHDCSEGNCSAADTGFTVEKLQLAKEYFAFNDCDDESPIWCGIGPRQATDLFGQEEYINIDYNTEKPMTTGRIIRNYHGVNWIVSSKITKGSSNDVDGDTDVFENWVWLQDAMILGVSDAISTEFSIRDDLSYSQQIYVHMNMGAMRMDEDKIIKIESQ